jgi:hypothetical protein
MTTVCYLAHCLLNANAKVDEGARCAGVYSPVVELLRRHGCTIRQMPCPELGFGGTRRFWAVREQYDTPAFRAHCKRLAEPVAAQIRVDLERQARVVIVGIDGSPSMGGRAHRLERRVGREAAQAPGRGLSRRAGRRPFHGDPAGVARGRGGKRADRRPRPGPLRLRRAGGARKAEAYLVLGRRRGCEVMFVAGGSPLSPTPS